MKFLLEQPTYSLYNNQERIKFFQNNQLIDNQASSSSIETLQSVLEKTFFTNKISYTINNNYFINKSENFSTNHYCSSLSKRIQTYSLSNHSTMAITAITSFSEEQTNSFDYDNTYFYPEEINKLDDISSLTTITSYLPMELNTIEHDTSVYSDMTSFCSDSDDISESIIFDIQQNKNSYISSDIQNLNVENEKMTPINVNLTSCNSQFTGLVYAIKCTIIKEKETDDEQTLSVYDNVNYYSEQNNKIRSHADNVSLNLPMTSSIQDNHCPMTFTGEQLNKQEKKRTNEQQEEDDDNDDDDDDDDDYFIVDQQKTIDQLTMMNNENEIENDEEYDHDNEHFESTRLYDNGQHDGNLSDESQYSDDLKYSLDTTQNSCTNDNFNNTSSILRQEAISITKVRCKQRTNWIRSSPPTTINNNSTNFIKSFSLNDHVDGTNATSTCLNSNVNSTTHVQTAATMLLHKNSIDCNKNENKNGEALSYDLLQLNHDHGSIKTNKSILPPMLKPSNAYDKDASTSSITTTTSKKTNSFYFIHHQSSLVPIQDLLNKNINKNIEIIQMDEDECILEIVDGALTLVPKDKSTSSTTNSYEEKSEDKRNNSIGYQRNNNYDSSKRKESSSSITSSVSTPSLSEHEQEQDQEQERDEITSSRLSWNKEEEAQGPFILIRDVPSKSSPLPSQSSPLPSQSEQSVDLLDLFSTPVIPLSNSNSNSNANNNNKNTKNLLDDSLSSVSSYEINNNNINDNNSSSDSFERKKIRSSSPIQNQFKSSSSPIQNQFNSSASPIQNQFNSSASPIQNQSMSSSSSTSIKDDIPPVSTSLNKSSVLTELVQTIEKPEPELIDETEIDYPIPKTEPPPAAKPINRARISEFASLLSSSVHLTPPQTIKKQEIPKTISTINRPLPSPSRSEDQSFSSVQSINSDRDERESYHTVKSNNNSEQEQSKKHIDARYNEKIDDRNSIQINTSNIKALFEQKISDTNKALTQSSEHLLHLHEARQRHRKVPVSYGSLKRNLPNNPQQTTSINTNRRQTHQDFPTMNKYTDHIVGTKDVVIEDKQPESVRQTQRYVSNTRRNNTDQIIRPGIDSLITSPVSIPNGYYSETLIAREIRETKEKEEELRRQRKQCGLTEDLSSLKIISNNDLNQSDISTKQPIKSNSFLSNLDFFTSKVNNSSNELPSPRRSTISIQNIVYDSHTLSPPSPSSSSSSHDERKQISNIVSQELNRFNNNGIPIIRTSSTNNVIHRSSSNQNMLSTQNTNNIIQREIEAIRAKEAELRQLGRIQHTSDEHSDPRKYQELVSTLPKSQSVNTLSTGKVRRDSGRSSYGPMIVPSNGVFKTKPMNNNNNSSISSIRGKFPSPNPTAPIISSSNKSIDYSKLSTTDRLELEKRECQEREQELRKQRHSITSIPTILSPTVNNDSEYVIQDEHEEDHEGYFDRIERLKRTEDEKTHAPIIRPAKKLDLSQRWEQMIAHKTTDDNDDDDDN
ncbi:unnamed protein product [Rotaria sordida]|uniref:Uncharacterized protein n=1 Tax=Rotaria sordida TaxID=392033 RepID=A0A814Q9F0_9BILA|nr:unnamed protein product [Rotaria sordida]